MLTQTGKQKPVNSKSVLQKDVVKNSSVSEGNKTKNNKNRASKRLSKSERGKGLSEKCSGPHTLNRDFGLQVNVLEPNFPFKSHPHHFLEAKMRDPFHL